MRLPYLRISFIVLFATAGARADRDSFQLKEATIADIHAAYEDGRLTPEQLVQMYLDRINAFDRKTTPQPLGANSGEKHDQPLNSFMHVNENALSDARSINVDDDDDASPLRGIPVILKDNIATADMPTTAGSVALGGTRPKRDATITAKLRAAGAIILGKGSLTEFANFISTSMTSGFSSQLRFQIFFQAPGSDITKIGYGYNPYEPEPDNRTAVPIGGGQTVNVFDGTPAVTPGGSSSGPGIAVSSNFATVGVGTETSGSILSPSSANMLVGIKPTLGLVSRHGIVPITEDQDTAGPIARTVTDAAKLLGVLAGFDPQDPATSDCLNPGNCFRNYTRFLRKNSLKGARIAVPIHPYQTGPFGFTVPRSKVIAAARAAIEAAGATVVNCDIPSQTALSKFGTCTTPTLVGLRRANGNAFPPAPCSTVLLNGFRNHLDAYLADPDFGPGVSVSTPDIPVRTIQNLDDIIDFNKTTTHPNNPEVQMKYGQNIALAAQMLTTQQDVDDYKADRAYDLLLTRTCGLDILFTGHIPTGQNGEVDCTPFIQDWLTPNPQTTNLTNCVGQKFDAVLFPANFGANPPARAGYPSVTVPAGRFSFTTVFDNGFVPRQSPIGVTFTGPRFSEPKLIGLAYSFEQTPITTPATSDATPEHREPPPDPNLN